MDLARPTKSELHTWNGGRPIRSSIVLVLMLNFVLPGVLSYRLLLSYSKLQSLSTVAVSGS